MIGHIHISNVLGAEDTEVLEFSPKVEYQQTIVAARNIAAMQGKK